MKKSDFRAPKWYTIVDTVVGPFKAPVHVTKNLSSILRQNYMNVDSHAAVLLAGSQDIFQGLIASDIAHELNRFLNLKGYKADWIFNATKGDLESVLESDKYQSIVTMGHGTMSTWDAYDGLVRQKVISEFYGDRPKKTGYWIQQACGTTKGKPLGIDVMERPRERCRFYLTDVNAMDYNYLGPPTYTLAGLDSLKRFLERQAQTV